MRTRIMQRAQALGDAVHRDVDERLGAVLQIGGSGRNRISREVLSTV